MYSLRINSEPKEAASEIAEVLTREIMDSGNTVSKPLIRVLSHIVAEVGYREAAKQATQISSIREDFWTEVKKEIDIQFLPIKL